MKLISSKDNTVIKEISRLLSSKKERNDKGLFVVEGIRACEEIIKCGIAVKTALITGACREKFQNQGEFILNCSDEIYEITEAVANKISDTKTPQGIFCLCKMPKRSQEIKKGGNYIMLCSMQDPGNIGTIIRSCDAFKMDGLIMTGDCPDIFSPKVFRSTMGTALRMNIIVFENAEKACEKLKNAGIKIYAAALSENSRNIEDCDLMENVCVMIGNEGNGLSESEIGLADEKIIIPMNESSESLNGGVAASIFAWEMFRRKMRG